MRDVLSTVHGPALIVRPPVPVTLNKAGANYKSEVTHLEYSPRRAYDEWLAICEGILAFGGDAIFDFESSDDRFLDIESLSVDAEGRIRPAGSSTVLGHVDDIDTGRVFAANGPWVMVEEQRLRALMPNMLAHRVREGAYYRALLGGLAASASLDLEISENPHRWEGMADVAVVGDRAVLTYTEPGHYDQSLPPKSMRSARAGVEAAARFAGLPPERCIYVELVYPHFHGDTVHFGARPSRGGEPAVLVHYAGGLWGEGAKALRAALGADRIVPIERDDAVEKYAGNSRQVRHGVLVPDGVSAGFVAALERLGLDTRRVPLFELFGKAGGGPACATLYLPTNLEIPANSPLRYSARRDQARRRRERIADRLTVDPGLFAGRSRG